MPNYNGKGSYFCKNCGGGRGIHHWETMACPANGEDQTGNRKQEYTGTNFDPQDFFGSLEVADSRTLFDDYFLAALASVSAIFSSDGLTQSEVEELLPDVVVACAFDITEAAMKKREEYFAGKVNKNE
ncbi:MAG: hypothetical protein LBL64_02585 [Treponema sp.]|nr:hypothetical protein [Treponema sp.]